MTFDLGNKVTQEVAQYPLHHVTYAPTKFEVDMSNLGNKVTQSVAQYPLHHSTYAPAKFEVATSNGLGGDAQYLTLSLGFGYIFLQYINLEKCIIETPLMQKQIKTTEVCDFLTF